MHSFALITWYGSQIRNRGNITQAIRSQQISKGREKTQTLAKRLKITK
jgi:hypothetical protein